MTATPEPVVPASRRPVPGSPEPGVPTAPPAATPARATPATTAPTRQAPSTPAPTAPAPATRQRPTQPPPLRSATEIQQEIVQTRQRLADTIDELVERVHPRNVIERSKRQLTARVATSDGSPRPEVVGALAGAVLVVGLMAWWARRRRARRLKG